MDNREIPFVQKVLEWELLREWKDSEPSREGSEALVEKTQNCGHEKNHQIAGRYLGISWR